VLAASILRFIDLFEYPLTLDELTYVYWGKIYVSNWENRLFDLDHWLGNYEHPPIGKYLIGLSIVSLSPIGISEIAAARLIMALLSVATCVLIFFLGRELYDWRTGLVAALMLTFDPIHLGQSRYALLDVPMLFFMVASAFFFIKGIKLRDWQSTINLALSGIAFGLAFGTKYIAFTLPIAFFGVLVSSFILKRKTSRGLSFPNFRLLGYLCWGVFAIVVFVSLWPYLWSDPIGNLSSSFEFQAVRAMRKQKIFFLGRPYHQVPWFFPLAILLGSITPFELVAVLLGCWLVLRFVFRRQWRESDLLAPLWFLATLIFLCLWPVKLAHWIVILSPPLALLAGVGIANLLNYKFLKRVLFIGLLLLLVVPHALSATAACPYYDLYFSPLVGGSQNAVNLYPVGGSIGLKEAAQYLAAHSTNGTKVAVRGYPVLLQYYEPGLVFARAPSSYQKLKDMGFAYIVFQIDFIQEDPEHPIWLAFKDLPPDYVVVIQGIPLVYIYRIT
jgi:4-amino-4-deoxy-L-arabinose transferase-like glycosyltransferase